MPNEQENKSIENPSLKRRVGVICCDDLTQVNFTEEQKEKAMSFYEDILGKSIKGDIGIGYGGKLKI